MSRSDATTTNFRDVARDRVTGVPATPYAGDHISDGSHSDQIEQEIRRTRAKMSATLDQIEDRISPARMKRELKHTIDETIADVRDEYNPKRMAKRAGDTMLDTIKDHPLASLAAGLSVGYLAMKGAEDSGKNRSYERRMRRSTIYDEYDGNAAMSPRGPQYAEFSTASHGRLPGDYMHEGTERGRNSEFEMHDREGTPYGRADEIRDRADEMRGRLHDRTEEARARADDLVHESADRFRDVKDATLERTHSAARSARRSAHSAGSQLEDFLYENPLAAGAIAVGIGALVGGLFPSTGVEDRYMGATRDHAMDRARHVADETLEHGREAAARVASEAKEAAQEVASEAKHAVKGVAAKGKEEAKNVQGTARRSATEMMGHSQSQGNATKETEYSQGTTQRSATEETPYTPGAAQRITKAEDREGSGTAQRSPTERGRESDSQDRPFGSSVK